MYMPCTIIYNKIYVKQKICTIYVWLMYIYIGLMTVSLHLLPLPFPFLDVDVDGCDACSLELCLP